MRFPSPLLLLILTLAACNSRTLEWVTQTPEEQALQATSRNDCLNYEDYIPSLEHPSHSIKRIVRINIHVIRDDNGRGNFPDSAEAVDYILNMVNHANQRLRENTAMHLPIGNSTEVLPIGYQYELCPDPKIPGDDGIYFHNDSEMAFFNKKGGTGPSNLHSSAQFDKYGKQKGKVINVFLLEHPPDSLKFGKSYNVTTNGVGYGDFAKLAGCYSVWQSDPATKGFWFVSGLLNHEIGHCFGLGHTWNMNDGCDDTPMHPNCWGSAPSGPCKTGWSNNTMDYNNYQNAMTPCQIGKVHLGFSKPGKRRNKLQNTWCGRQGFAQVIIPYGDSMAWEGFKDVGGDLIIQANARLSVYCDLNMPEGSKIVVQPGAKLYLLGVKIQNDCGNFWRGIELKQQGSLKGEVIFKNGSKLFNVRPKESKNSPKS